MEQLNFPPKLIVKIINEQELLDWAKVELKKEGIVDFSNLSIKLDEAKGHTTITNDGWKILITSNECHFTFYGKKHRKYGPSEVGKKDGTTYGYYYECGQFVTFPLHYSYAINDEGLHRNFRFDDGVTLSTIQDVTNGRVIKIQGNAHPSYSKKNIKLMVDYIVKNYDATLVEFLLSPDAMTREYAEIALNWKA